MSIINQERRLKSYAPMTETAFYILLSLVEPRHGYGIIKHVRDITGGRIQLGSGTVYGTLTKMKRDGLIVVYADELRKKQYEITDLGRSMMKKEMERIKELYKNVCIYEEGF